MFDAASQARIEAAEQLLDDGAIRLLRAWCRAGLALPGGGRRRRLHGSLPYVGRQLPQRLRTHGLVSVSNEGRVWSWQAAPRAPIIVGAWEQKP